MGPGNFQTKYLYMGNKEVLVRKITCLCCVLGLKMLKVHGMTKYTTLILSFEQTRKAPDVVGGK